jgi:diguanylate cyclase (GGDEF)-like protein
VMGRLTGALRALRSWWPWLLALLMASGGVFLLARWLIDVQLHDHAIEEGQHWVEFVEQSVPELEAALAGRALPAAALERLQLLASADEVVAFRLHGATGALVHQAHAASLDLPKAAHADRNVSDLRAVLADGRARAQLHHDGPEPLGHFAVSTVALQRGGVRLGAFSVVIDQSERAESIESGFWWMSSAVALLLLTVGGSAIWRVAYQMRRRLKVEDRVRYLAAHDVLSGALNRASFNDLLELSVQAGARGGERVAVLALDLDHFKDINDRHGHAVGDQVLQAFSQRLRAVLRQGDMLARLGGDEFAVLQRGLAEPEDAERLALRIVQAMSQPIVSGDILLHCGVSVGIALQEPGQADARAMLQQADAALYQAKQQGRGRYAFFDATLGAAVREQRALLEALGRSLDNGEMHLAYQGFYRVSGAAAAAPQLAGFEALMRWTPRGGEAISPARFIPLAEDSGHIMALGRWALHEACRQAARWPEPLTVAVNLSAVQFRQGDLVQTVREVLQESGLAPKRLELEITESLLLGHAEQVLSTLSALHALGVRVTMDDFGTGYSSLAYLWQFPFDKIKIDRAFVRDLLHDARARLIVEAVLQLARRMEREVTAEGVEDAQQLQLLGDLGCDLVQGFLLARPLPAEALNLTPAPLTTARRESP